MATSKQVFVLVGALAGQSLSVNGHEFVDGKLEYTGDDTTITVLARIFSFYGAFKAGEEPRTPDGRLLTDPLGGGKPADDSEELAAQAQKLEDEKAAALKKVEDEKAAEAQRLEDEKLAAAKQASDDEAARRQDEADQAELDAAAEAKALADKEAADKEALDKALGGNATSSSGGIADESTKPTLAEAIGQLDPENESAWTSNNLPAIDLLSELTGLKVTRSDVEATAAGYTRAKARAARG